MDNLRKKQTAEYKEFNANKIKNEIVEWIRDFFRINGPDCNAVVGISGGKDSSIVAALCVEAIGKNRVIGVLMPNGEQSDIDVARTLVSFLGIASVELDIAAGVKGVQKGIANGICKGFKGNCADEGISLSEQAYINLPPRIRMAALYAISQSLGGRVANTCNLSEDWVGYATRYGDSVGDFSPLSQLTVTEVKAVGYALGLPKEFIEKIPVDGLCGKTDEENLGFSYDVLDEYIRTGVCQDGQVKQRIDDLHERNLFKLKPMPSFLFSKN